MTPALTGTRARVLEVAQKEIGTVESPSGSNRQKYGEAYGMNGVAWCAEFVWWVFREAGVPLLLKTAYTPALAAAYQKANRWLVNTSDKVQPGDIVLFYWPNMGRIAHVGIVEKVLANGDIQTIEGNTDERGGRTGGKVMRRIRSRATIHRNGGFALPVFTKEEGVPDPAKPTDDEAKPLSNEQQHKMYERVKGMAAMMHDIKNVAEGTVLHERFNALEDRLAAIERGLSAPGGGNG